MIDPMPDALRHWQRENRWLTLAFWVNAGLLVLALAAMPFDHRLILGISPWVKPLKFDVSVLIYAFTAAVAMRLLGGLRLRARHWVGFWIGVAMIVENTLITLQSVRGVQSHMNFSSAFDGAVFAIMGIFIVVNTVCVAWLLGLWCTRRAPVAPALAWGIRLGLVAFFAGGIEAGAMFPHMAHTVGARDGGPGLPLVNWSTGHGDLRVAHFFALHALQVMILLGWGLSRLRWPERTKVLGVWTVFVAYMGAVWMLFAQAMAGRPLLR